MMNDHKIIRYLSRRLRQNPMVETFKVVVRYFPKRPRQPSKILLAIAMFSLVVACDGFTPNFNNLANQVNDETLEVWWSEGYYPEETNAIRDAVRSWSAESDTKINLQFFSEKDLTQQTQSALSSGSLPDIIYGYTLDFGLAPRLAWEGKLADTTDMIEPVQDQFVPEALESVTYFNQADNNRSFYAVPIAQNAFYVHYWRSLLEKTGLSDPENIPQDWNAFWQFWVNRQSEVDQENGKTIYGLGLPMSPAATDTHYFFEQMLEAYDVRVLDGNGQFILNNPNGINQLTQVLSQVTNFYKQGYVPPNAVNWSDPDNNVAFLSRRLLMTVNATLSIPGSQRQAPSTYQEDMVTMEWPQKPSGDPMRYIVSTKQMVIPKDTNQLQAAKDLVSYLIQPEVLGKFNKGSQGRFFPVMSDLISDPFWNDPSDPHISASADYFERTRSPYTKLNPAYGEVQTNQIWGKALVSIVQDGVSPAEAAEEAIDEINLIFEEWE
ncbi:carbohydrate ABC transporter substrate-binding protein, CUT1 family [Halothece sp. PCC 7418]|uniref:ABC transporter substrate-binding protein n=1 Tax=Halothece sp. (strain PCC 7418) TaxID=65093 RepID=UPI0002A06A10|nr:ABC transporter substrate-binding protein [Halothece sp. PCC 7418]AFZ44137.1 carbohydrate ABC transporter substrate-binding protein, CUT1 family [Halothece sp. PCC 7418]